MISLVFSLHPALTPLQAPSERPSFTNAVSNIDDPQVPLDLFQRELMLVPILPPRKDMWLRMCKKRFLESPCADHYWLTMFFLWWAQLCVRAGDEKALAIRWQLLLEIHYMQARWQFQVRHAVQIPLVSHMSFGLAFHDVWCTQMRRAVAQARGEIEYDRALAKRAYLIHRRLETESDEDLRRNLAVRLLHLFLCADVSISSTCLLSIPHKHLTLCLPADHASWACHISQAMVSMCIKVCKSEELNAFQRIFKKNGGSETNRV